jgi:hypothetical protein
MNREKQKSLGAYYTPDEVVHALVRWAVRRHTDRLLDPSCGDGRFLRKHPHSVGVEHDPIAAAAIHDSLPGRLVHQGDFFSWAASTTERFDCAAGNPPFIRYQRFSGSIREAALNLCSRLGASFSALASSWAPFLVATASLLRPGGRLAFVVPAEIGHAPYATPLLEYLLGHFSDVRLLAIRKKLFGELSEDCWLLYASGFGDRTVGIRMVAVDSFDYGDMPPEGGVVVTSAELRKWRNRLRPFLLSPEVRTLYQEGVSRSDTCLLGHEADVGIGYVTGANDFFHLRPSDAVALRIPSRFLVATVRNGKALPERVLTKQRVESWIKADEPVLLLRIRQSDRLPLGLLRYLETTAAKEARKAYKCAIRDPWYVVPDVTVPDAFLTYMSGQGPSLVANEAAAVGTNSVHMVKLQRRALLKELQNRWNHPFTALSCEMEGHPLGGGMLKLEPREAQRIALVTSKNWSKSDLRTLQEGVFQLRLWRHFGGSHKEERERLRVGHPQAGL